MAYTKISFIILTWNSEKYIEKCLASIENTTGIDKEIFVVDNGSTDLTKSILKKHDISAIFLDKNMGTTYPRNLAIKKCGKDSEFICILDSDTEINEQAFINMVNILRSDKTYGIIGPKMYNKNNILQVTAKKFPTVKIKLFKAIPFGNFHDKGTRLEHYNFDQNADYSIVDYIISACWLIKREAAEKIGLLDEKIFYSPEDVDYCIRAWQSGFKVLYAQNCSIIHDTQRISKKKFFSYINYTHVKGLIYYFIKHKYWFNAPNTDKWGDIKK